MSSNSLHIDDVLAFGKKLASKGDGLVLDAVAFTCLTIHLNGDSKASRAALKGSTFQRQASVIGDNLMTLKKIDVPVIVANANVTPDDVNYIGKLASAIVKTVKSVMIDLETTSNIAFYNKLAKLVKAADAKIAEQAAIDADKAAKAAVWNGNKAAAMAAGMSEEEAAEHANALAAAAIKAEYDLAEAKAAIAAQTLAAAIVEKEKADNPPVPVPVPIASIPAQVSELLAKASNEELRAIYVMLEAERLSREDQTGVSIAA